MAELGTIGHNRDLKARIVELEKEKGSVDRRLKAAGLEEDRPDLPPILQEKSNALELEIAIMKGRLTRSVVPRACDIMAALRSPKG